MLDKLLGAQGPSDPSRTNPLSGVLKECKKAFWLTAWLTFLVELLSIAPVLYMMNMYDRVMTSRSEVTLVSLTLLVLGLYVFWSSLEWLRTRLMVRKAEANRLASQTLQLSETALAIGMQPDLRKRWYVRHQRFLGLQAHASEAAGVMGGMSGFLQKAFPSLQMALGIYLAIEGLITGGMVIAATTLITKALPKASMSAMVLHLQRLQLTSCFWARIQRSFEAGD